MIQSYFLNIDPWLAGMNKSDEAGMLSGGKSVQIFSLLVKSIIYHLKVVDHLTWYLQDQMSS